LDLDEGFSALRALAPPRGLSFQLGDLLVPRVGTLRDGPALLRCSRQLAALAGALVALAPKKRGRPATPVSPLARRVAELERDKARLERRLQQAEAIIEAQKKLSEILGLSAPMPGEAGSTG
jgi:hypothetical protein